MVGRLEIITIPNLTEMKTTQSEFKQIIINTVKMSDRCNHNKCIDFDIKNLT